MIVPIEKFRISMSPHAILEMASYSFERKTASGAYTLWFIAEFFFGRKLEYGRACLSLFSIVGFATIHGLCSAFKGLPMLPFDRPYTCLGTWWY